MELGLSLGDASKPPFEFNSLKQQQQKKKRGRLCMALGINSHKLEEEEEENDVDESSDDYTALHLNLLPLPHSLSSDNGSWENGSSGNYMEASSANSVGSMDLGICLRNHVVEDENGLNHTKKLRLSKQQSASLEETFKENNTLNPKEKVALAKQLNLRPRQVEVWFQNRRARTKLKQTEVDCEYLKRCSETLTEENRRLQKELEELRALKSNPFHMQLPATTLTMCPACQRLATLTAAAAETSIPFSQIPSQPNHT